MASENTLWKWNADPTKKQKFYVILSAKSGISQSVMALTPTDAAVSVISRMALNDLVKSKSSTKKVSNFEVPAQIIVSTSGDLSPKTITKDWEDGVYKGLFTSASAVDAVWLQNHKDDVVIEAETLFPLITKAIEESFKGQHSDFSDMDSEFEDDDTCEE